MTVNMNIFDKILILSERAREISRRQKQKESIFARSLISGPETDRYFQERKKQELPSIQAINEFESGEIGAEYLNNIRKRRSS